NEFGRDAAISAYLRLLFVAIARIRHQRNLGTISLTADENLFGRFRTLVEAHYRERHVIGEYAKELTVTESRLAAACRRVVGHAPLDVIHARVIVEAKRSLLYTAMTVAEIGFTLGFDDPAYFSRFFTHSTGITPTAFRDKSVESTPSQPRASR
ncbi:MAG: helix-turn-helix domain-containing protein, partial [Candidatus Binataceae bacterium]